MRHIATLKLVSDSDEELENDVFLPEQPNHNNAAILVGKMLVVACVCCALYSIIRHDGSTSTMGNVDDYLTWH